MENLTNNQHPRSGTAPGVLAFALAGRCQAIRDKGAETGNWYATGSGWKYFSKGGGRGRGGVLGKDGKGGNLPPLFRRKGPVAASWPEICLPMAQQGPAAGERLEMERKRVLKRKQDTQFIHKEIGKIRGKQVKMTMCEGRISAIFNKFCVQNCWKGRMGESNKKCLAILGSLTYTQHS